MFDVIWHVVIVFFIFSHVQFCIFCLITVALLINTIAFYAFHVGIGEKSVTVVISVDD